MKQNENLKLENQLCFPIYLLSKSVVNTYNFLLEPLNLTYTQYLVMMVLWEYEEIEMKELCLKLFLDSNTLTPVINRLIKKEYIKKYKKYDKRKIYLSLQKDGEKIKEKIKDIQITIFNIVNLNSEEVQSLCTIINKVMNQLEEFEKIKKSQKNIN